MSQTLGQLETWSCSQQEHPLHREPTNAGSHNSPYSTVTIFVWKENLSPQALSFFSEHSNVHSLRCSFFSKRLSHTRLEITRYVSQFLFGNSPHGFPAHTFTIEANFRSDIPGCLEVNFTTFSSFRVPWQHFTCMFLSYKLQLSCDCWAAKNFYQYGKL